MTTKTAYRDAAGHRCATYISARDEVCDPAEQEGIGCPRCYPPDGRASRENPDPMHLGRKARA